MTTKLLMGLQDHSRPNAKCQIEVTKDAARHSDSQNKLVSDTLHIDIGRKNTMTANTNPNITVFTPMKKLCKPSPISSIHFKII